MIERAYELEQTEKRWQEWLAFAPLAALNGHSVPFSAFMRQPQKPQAEDKDITDIKRRFGI